MAWNSGIRPASRAGCSSSASQGNGHLRWARASSDSAAAESSSSSNAAAAPGRPRSTTGLTKYPTVRAQRAAPGGRHADPDLLVARDPVEQELEAGQEGGEESGAALPDERLEARRR